MPPHSAQQRTQTLGVLNLDKPWRARGMVPKMCLVSSADGPPDGPLFVISTPHPSSPMKKHPELLDTNKKMSNLLGLRLEAPTCLSNLISYHCISLRVPHQDISLSPPSVPPGSRGIPLSDRQDHRHRRKEAIESIPHPGISPC